MILYGGDMRVSDNFCNEGVDEGGSITLSPYLIKYAQKHLQSIMHFSQNPHFCFYNIL